MGYTQYYQQQRTVTNTEWEGIMTDAAQIIQATIDSGIPLARSYEEQDQPPSVGLSVISFNGIACNGHEDFFLPRVMEVGWQGEKYRFNFCKTARKPYDVAVGAIMLSMHHHAPGAWDLASDGGAEELEWENAAKMYSKVTGREVEWFGSE